jgi:hypothetical protein
VPWAQPIHTGDDSDTGVSVEAEQAGEPSAVAVTPWPGSSEKKTDKEERRIRFGNQYADPT